MSFYSVDIKPFKRIFYQTAISNCIILSGAALLASSGLLEAQITTTGNRLSQPILLGMVLVAWIHSVSQRKQLARIVTIENFDQQIREYEKHYRRKMLWYFTACLISAILFIVTAKWIFLLFGVMDIVFSIAFFPRVNLFKRELQNDEIMLY